MYQRGKHGWLKHYDFIILDMICLQLSFIVAYFIRNGIKNPYESFVYGTFGLVASLLSLIVAFFFETYRDVLKRGLYRELIATFRHVLMVALLSIAYTVAVRISDNLSRLVMWQTFLFYFLLTYVGRAGWKLFLKKMKKLEDKRTFVLVTSGNQIQERIAELTTANPTISVVGVYAVDGATAKGKNKGIRVFDNQKQMLEFVCREWVDEAFLDAAVPEEIASELSSLFTQMGIVTHRELAKEKREGSSKQFVEHLAGYTVLTTSINNVGPYQLFMKRLMDIAGGLVGCLITAVIFVVVAPIVKIQSPGPVFFRQERIGRNGKHFKMYKFRSMYMDAEERKKELMSQNRVKDGMMFKLEHDPRIIGSKIMPDGTYRKGVGNLIRDWSLDEFPQFFNVLKGDMSLVGTRPPTLDEWEKYELHHRARMATKPGITGMWQANGRSEITDFEEVVKLDTKYINEWNFGLDIKLILKTIISVFKKEGSM